MFPLSQVPGRPSLFADKSPEVARVLTATSISMLALALAGCAMGNFTSGTAPVAATAGIAGRVHGGQQPHLRRAGATHGTRHLRLRLRLLRSSSPPLRLRMRTAHLPCPGLTPVRPIGGLVYLLATGGNAGAGVNSAIAEAAIVGNCNSLSASTFVNISEVTTIAAAYALAPFATITAGTPQTTNVGTSLTNLQGLYNAAGPAANLANNLTGFAHVSATSPALSRLRLSSTPWPTFLPPASTRGRPTTRQATAPRSSAPPNPPAALPRPIPSRPRSISHNTPAPTYRHSLVSSPPTRPSSPLCLPHPTTSPSRSDTTAAPSL